MIDWLLDILYNIGMAIGAVIAAICAAVYFSVEAEYKNPNVSNYRMLQEMRKLNRLQREQIEQEKTAHIQAQMRPLNVTQQESESTKPLGFWERMNAKLEDWNQRLDEKAAQQKQARLAKRQAKQSQTQSAPAPIQASEAQIEENDSNADYTPELARNVVNAQFDLIVQVEGLEKILNEELSKAQTMAALTELEKKLPVDFWEKITVFKRKYAQYDALNLLAEIEALEKEYIEIKRQINMRLYSNSRIHHTPPPLPPLD